MSTSRPVLKPPSCPSSGPSSGPSSEKSAGAALVTGGAIRIGRQIVLSLAEKGWDVAIHCHRSTDAAHDLARQAGALTKGKVIVLTADLSSEDACRRLPHLAAEQLGSLDCVINNASVFYKDDPDNNPKEIWDDNMAVNLRAPFWLSLEFAALLKSTRGANGNIVNIIDERVWNLTPYFLSYTASKAGLWTLTRSLALSLAPHIRVNAIGPGLIIPDAGLSREQFDALSLKLPLRRPGSVEEICDAIHFFLRSPSVTGQMIAIDSGQHLGWGHCFDPGIS